MKLFDRAYEHFFYWFAIFLGAGGIATLLPSSVYYLGYDFFWVTWLLLMTLGLLRFFYRSQTATILFGSDPIKGNVFSLATGVVFDFVLMLMFMLFASVGADGATLPAFIPLGEWLALLPFSFVVMIPFAEGLKVAEKRYSHQLGELSQQLERVKQKRQPSDETYAHLEIDEEVVTDVSNEPVANQVFMASSRGIHSRPPDPPLKIR